MQSKQIMIRLPEELRKAAEDKAAKLGLNLTSYIRMILKADTDKGI